MLQDPIGYCAAVSQSNTALQSALSDALNKMVSGGVMNIIQNKWYGTSIDLSSLPVIKSASTRS
jgi:polar amino acid transport system substrate-binding protein